jgi:hypothetical protein
MANKAPTPASVLASANATIGEGIIAPATTVLAGDWLYQLADDTWGLARADQVAPIHNGIAVALTGGGAGQPTKYCTYDPNFTPGFAIAVHEVIIGSGATAAGKFAPIADNATGWYLTMCMVGIGSNKARLQFVHSGVPKP